MRTRPDPPLTAREIEAWQWSLGRTLIARLRAIEALLRHEGTDRMSLADRQICRTSAARLRRVLQG